MGAVARGQFAQLAAGFFATRAESALSRVDLPEERIVSLLDRTRRADPSPKQARPPALAAGLPGRRPRAREPAPQPLIDHKAAESKKLSSR